MATTMKGPGIFLAQFAGDAAPFNSLPSIAKWAGDLGYKGVQIPAWDGRLFDLKKAADSKTYCDEVKGICAEAGVAFDYVPGITSAQGAAASTGVPLTHRGLATGVRYVTGHRARNALLDLDWASLASPETTLVVYMGVANIAEIAAQLMGHGLAADTPVLAVAAATTPREARVLSRLDEVAVKAAQLAPDAPVLFLIGRVVSLYEPVVLAQALACSGAGMDAYA